MGRDNLDSEHGQFFKELCCKREQRKDVLVKGSGVREGFLKGRNNGVIG